MIELILFLLLFVYIWTIGYDDIKEEIKELNDKIDQLKKD